MSPGLDTDPDVLRGVSGVLHTAGIALGDAGAQPPPEPDAGEMTGGMAAAMSIFAEHAGLLAMGMAWAGDQVTAAVSDYAGTDGMVADSFPGGS